MTKITEQLATQEELQEILDNLSNVESMIDADKVEVAPKALAIDYACDVGALLDHTDGLTRALSLCQMDRIRLIEEVKVLKELARQVPDLEDGEELWKAIRASVEMVLGAGCLNVDKDLRRGTISQNGDPIMIVIVGDHPLTVHLRATGDQLLTSCVIANLTGVARPIAFGEYFEYDDHGCIITGSNALTWAANNYTTVMRRRYPGIENLANKNRLRVGEYDEMPSPRKRN